MRGPVADGAAFGNGGGVPNGAESCGDPAAGTIGAEPGTPRNAELDVRDSALKEKLLIALRQRAVGQCWLFGLNSL